jgi:cytochrome c oxidase cbb3-type subunit 3
MADKKSIDQATGTETVGHEWDGIEELNTPLPRWWLWTFYATIVWGIAYTIAYPAWPLVSSASAGVLNWSSRSELNQELAADAARKAPLLKAIAATPIEQLPAKPQLWQAAVEGGHAAFRNNCTQCHGTGAAGTTGYPNLNDDDWLWGGDLKALEYTIAHGVRNPQHDKTRASQMPAFGRDGLLQPGEIADVVAYVRTISRQQAPNAEARRGAATFAANCAACHGATGTGNRAVGAPNLTDAIWLYGGDQASLTNTVSIARAGVMPRWEQKLGPTQVKMLAAYVYSLGGGERAPVQMAEASPKP